MPKVPELPNNGGLMRRLDVSDEGIVRSDEGTRVIICRRIPKEQEPRLPAMDFKREYANAPFVPEHPKKKKVFNQQPIARHTGKCTWCGGRLSYGTIHDHCKEVQERVEAQKRKK